MQTKKKLSAQFLAKSRDESFKPNQSLKNLKCYSNSHVLMTDYLVSLDSSRSFPIGSVICFFISIQKPLPISFRHIRCDTQKFSPPQLNTPLMSGPVLQPVFAVCSIFEFQKSERMVLHFFNFRTDGSSFGLSGRTKLELGNVQYLCLSCALHIQVPL